jgi:ribonucleoside-diphosphate reductase alpha chain
MSSSHSDPVPAVSAPDGSALPTPPTPSADVPDVPEPTSSVPAPDQGLSLNRYFTEAGKNPFDQVVWERRSAGISNEKGEAVFRQDDCEIPAFWSQMATNVVVSKYFRGPLGSPTREYSVRQLIGRVVDTMTLWGKQGRYFQSPADAEVFHDELTHLLLNQYASFNSPVWFNVGVERHPQCSACFINSVEDTMQSIMTLARTEGMLFKYGSGTGTNLSPLRSSVEQLQGGGSASGPVSFMKGFDAFAGVIKSGGKTRRAAKMVILNTDHPDILDFIECKAREEKKAWALIDAGYDGSFNGEAYSSVFFQNSNNSVRVTDEFMQAYEKDGEYQTRFVTNGKPAHTLRAREVARKIADAAWLCGDPGIQFDTTVNRWHTCKASGRINASNPCSEYMFLDDSACNLASLNLLRFLREDGSFDVEAFRHAIRIVFLAQEIIISFASYPTEKIGMNSERFRPIGLGYANLGALLMALGVPYDSEDGRAVAAAVSALMTGEAYCTSALIAATKGTFEAYPENRESMLDVMAMHRAAAYKLTQPKCLEGIVLEASRRAWNEAAGLGKKHGYRNAQATVIAPTGTIGFMMDCDTTGIEPDLALVKYKKLVGGGEMKIVNKTVRRALGRLGYAPEAVMAIEDYIDAQETIEGAPGLRPEHLPVFDCSFRPRNGKRSISYMGHVRMMAAVQPFVSGAISKTVNMPNDVAAEDIERVYSEAWRMGLKALAIYRDGCKRTQPMSTARGGEKAAARTQAAQAAASATVPAPEPEVRIVYMPQRHRLPAERRAITHKFEIGNHEGYLTVGLYEDGKPGEVFIRMAKEGSTISGLMDSFATSISIALQYGVPLEVLVKKFCHTRFEPSGFTKNPEIPMAKSIMDYIFRWLAAKFLSAEEAAAVGIVRRRETMAPVPEEPKTPLPAETSSAHPDTTVWDDTATEAKRKPGNGSGSTESDEEEATGNGGSSARTATARKTAAETATQHAPRRIMAVAALDSDPLSSRRSTYTNQSDAPPCPECGAITVRNGSCYKCNNCGASLGCG